MLQHLVLLSSCLVLGGSRTAEAAQDDKEPAKEIVRVLRERSSHAYRIRVRSYNESSDSELSYTMTAKCGKLEFDGNQTSISFKFTNYETTTDEGSAHARVSGGGKMTLGQKGLPTELGSTLSDPHYWMPLLDWYIPLAIKDGQFEVAEDLGSGISLVGAGTFDAADRRFGLTGWLKDSRGNRSAVILAWQVDGRGWTVRGSGAVTDVGGTLLFEMNPR